jgi:hypothetical protein
LDSEGLLRGIILGFSTKFLLKNCYVVPSRLCVEVFSKEMDTSLTLLNLYRPYEDGEGFVGILFNTKRGGESMLIFFHNIKHYLIINLIKHNK